MIRTGDEKRNHSGAAIVSNNPDAQVCKIYATQLEDNDDKRFL